MKISILLAIILLYSSAFARVNMRNGSYSEKWIDAISPGKGYDFKIERFYSSRSIFIGLFGFGWCSNIETKIRHLSDGTISLTECGGGIEVTYYPIHFDKKSPDQTVDRIITHYKRSNRKLSSSYLKKLRTQLISDTKQRFEIANRLHLVNSNSLMKKRGSFVAKSKGLEQIKFDGRFYTRHDNKTGTVEKFGPDGRLIQIYDKLGQWIKINYKNKRISFLVDNKGRKFNFIYSNNGHLKKIHDGRKLNISYKFSGENLVQVTNAWNNTYTYKYDDHHNMTRISFPPKNNKPQFISLSYDFQNDWIKSYRDREGCLQQFNFILSQEAPKDHYWSNATGECYDQASSGHFEYWYKKYSNAKQKYLHRNLERQKVTFKKTRQSEETLKDIYFDPYLGRPIQIVENQNYTGYVYYPSGLPRQKEDKIYDEKRTLLEWVRTAYKYNKIRKMSEAIKNTLSSKGKVLLTSHTFFSYDKRRLLRRAKQKSGLFVDVDYNNLGKVATLTDHKKAKISFRYDGIHPKPISIRHSSLGEIVIEYNNENEIINVSSRKGRNIASSVIMSFTEFLELLGPAADEELKL